MSEEQMAQSLRVEVNFLRRKIDKKHLEIDELRQRIGELETENCSLRKKLNRYSKKHKNYQLTVSFFSYRKLREISLK